MKTTRAVLADFWSNSRAFGAGLPLVMNDAGLFPALGGERFTLQDFSFGQIPNIS